MLLELGNLLVASFPRFSFPGFWFSVFLPRNRQASIQAVLSTRDDPIPGQAREPDFCSPGDDAESLRFWADNFTDQVPTKKGAMSSPQAEQCRGFQ